jgi:hypothetical protein
MREMLVLGANEIKRWDGGTCLGFLGIGPKGRVGEY